MQLLLDTICLALLEAVCHHRCLDGLWRLMAPLEVGMGQGLAVYWQLSADVRSIFQSSNRRQTADLLGLGLAGGGELLSCCCFSEGLQKDHSNSMGNSEMCIQDIMMRMHLSLQLRDSETALQVGSQSTSFCTMRLEVVSHHA